MRHYIAPQFTPYYLAARMTHTLIFDLDGTLVDTAPGPAAGAANAVLAARDRPAIEPAALHHMIGFGARSLIAQAFAIHRGGRPGPRRCSALEAIFLDGTRWGITGTIWPISAALSPAAGRDPDAA